MIINQRRDFITEFYGHETHVSKPTDKPETARDVRYGVYKALGAESRPVTELTLSLFTNKNPRLTYYRLLLPETLTKLLPNLFSEDGRPAGET